MTELQKKMVEKLGLSQEDFQPKKATKVDELEAQVLYTACLLYTSGKNLFDYTDKTYHGANVNKVENGVIYTKGLTTTALNIPTLSANYHVRMMCFSLFAVTTANRLD